MSVIDDVKSRLDIVEVVSGYVPELKKAGRTWKARCPFHSERTPSFAVDPERQTWHCFGSCSTGGDVIEFVRKVENLDFREALQRLAERAGVELRAQSPREREEREQHERLLAANEAAAVFWQAALAGAEGAEARAYAERRGLDDATVRAWQLGFAPDGWRSLTDHLVARGFSEDDLIEAGLAIKGDRGVYDRFRYRLIFPTRDGRRRLIGFGARAMRPGDEPKYLNTPQTPLFDKSGNLYGLDRAGDAVRRLDRAVVVEGYMDVIACHQYGFEHVVASNGTSITEKQMALLKRYSHNVVLALDADAAGSAATLRGIEVARGVADRTDVALLSHGGLVRFVDTHDADIRIAVLPSGEDPDTLVRKSPDSFGALVNSATPLLDHVVAAAIRASDLSTTLGRARLVEDLAPLLAQVGSEVLFATYVMRLAHLAEVRESVVTDAVRRARGLAASRPSTPRPVPTQREVQVAKKTEAPSVDLEVQILTLLFHRLEARASGLDLSVDLFEDAGNRALFESWVADRDFLEHTSELDLALRERFDEILSSVSEAISDFYLPIPKVSELVESLGNALRAKRVVDRGRRPFVEASGTRNGRVDQSEEVLEARQVAEEADQKVRITLEAVGRSHKTNTTKTAGLGRTKKKGRWY